MAGQAWYCYGGMATTHLERGGAFTLEVRGLAGSSVAVKTLIGGGGAKGRPHQGSLILSQRLAEHHGAGGAARGLPSLRCCPRSGHQTQIIPMGGCCYQGRAAVASSSWTVVCSRRSRATTWPSLSSTQRPLLLTRKAAERRRGEVPGKLGAQTSNDGVARSQTYYCTVPRAGGGGGGGGGASSFLRAFLCPRSGFIQDGVGKRRTTCISPTRASSSSSSILSADGVPLGAQQDTLPSNFEKVVDILTNLFPVWVVIGTIVGLWRPAMVTWIHTDAFTIGLGLLMLSMGLTLTFEDFRRCLRNPWTVGVGFLAQYVIKPVLGFSISLALRLPAPLATGLILVSCCPGGQASNVATYISKGNVALSVLMTTCSTVGAIIMTPLLTKVLAGQLVPVDAVGLAVSTFQVVLLPTVVGVLSNEFFPSVTKKITFFTPLVGVLLTTLLCASPIGQVAEVLKTQGLGLVMPVGFLHAFAFFFGYWLSRACSFGEVTSRTVSIECGMQSSALGFLLAQKHFSNPLVAVPSAVSVVFMALGGAMLAVFWRMKGIPANDKDDFKA